MFLERLEEFLGPVLTMILGGFYNVENYHIGDLGRKFLYSYVNVPSEKSEIFRNIPVSLKNGHLEKKI